MSSLQSFLADSTIKAATTLETALLKLPEDKRNWKPAKDARSALDMVAECAIMNNSVIHMINGGDFPSDWAYIYYKDQIAALCEDWPTLQNLLHENASKVAEVILAIPSADLNHREDLADILSYPYWNMSYHEGQINYLAALLGCLD
ncbi:hypothetical protein EON83_11985 [bacterium]|nr:MAG: hypothetical protein EON83_11985 [bacterium]